MKNLITGFILFFFFPVCGQKSVHDSMKMYYQDSLIINKSFNNGTIKLTVKVINPCNSEKERFDGAVTMINAHIKNKHHDDSITYHYPYAQSGLINFKANNISHYTINKQIAVLIPFTYCGNWDNDTQVSYFIFYNRKHYLYHLQYYCEENGTCKIKDNVNMTLKDVPTALRLKVIKDSETKYNHSDDFN